MKTTETASGGGITFLGALTILFIGLKLTNYINWSWWLVLLPLYGPIAILLGFVLICILIWIIGCFCTAFTPKKKKKEKNYLY